MSGIKERVKKIAESNVALYFVWRCLQKAKYIWSRCSIILADLMRKRDKYCIICGHKVGKFLPFGIDEGIFTVHHIIGGGLRDNCICPYCKHIDRARWQYYVLTHHSNILRGECSVLHFAAEDHNAKLIQQNKKCRYITADIKPGRGDIVADITDLHMFEAGTFDYVIANHVLEHIPDEAKAISELKRVLKNDGAIILSFPICTDEPTYEDPSITTPEGRLKAFGQEDHVRLYGTDYKERLEKYGLEVTVYSPEKELTDAEVTYYGFIPDDVSIFCRKR